MASTKQFQDKLAMYVNAIEENYTHFFYHN